VSDATITAEVRTEFGKGAARRARRAGLVPAVLYGGGIDPIHISLPGHETFLAMKVANALLTLDIEGEERLALTKDVQRDPIRGDIEHVDLILVRRGQKVTVEVPVYLTGESAPGTIHTLELQTIRLEADATALPEHIEVSIEGLEEGTIIHTGDLELPAGSTLEEADDLAVVNIITAQQEEIEEDEELEDAEAAEEGEEAAESGEGEEE